MKLLSVAFPESPRGLRPALNYLSVGSDPPAYKDWTVEVRGGAVLLKSPIGWRPGMAPQGTKQLIVEVPRARCILQWEEDVEAESVQDHGAVGDGATDDGPAVQAAMDVAPPPPSEPPEHLIAKPARKHKAKETP